MKLDLKVDSDEAKNDGVEAVFENDLHYGNDVGFLIGKWGSNEVIIWVRDEFEYSIILLHFELFV